MGPFGGGIVLVMLPELTEAFAIPLAQGSWFATAYIIPFSLLMLVSGTIGTRFGRARVIRLAFGLYAAASVLCAVAVTDWMFLIGRALQGTANAFTSPLLATLVVSLVPKERFGRTMGIYVGVQAVGHSLAPLIGGISADIDWRIAFVASGVVAALLALAIPNPKNEAPAKQIKWGDLMNWRLGQSALVAFGAQTAAAGMLLIAPLLASDRFGLSPTLRGLVVASFGVGGYIAGTLSGRLADRIGVLRTGLMSMAALTIAVAALGWVPWFIAFVICILLGGAAATTNRILTNALAIWSTPSNPSGATSITMCFQFLGTGIAPIVLLPIYDGSPSGAEIAMLISAGLAILAGVATLLRRPAPPVEEEAGRA